MTIFTKQIKIAEYPALIVMQREAHNVNGVNVVELTSSDTLILNEGGKWLRKYKAGSVVSYALEYNEDPIAAVEDAKKRGDVLHWINPVAGCITSHDRDKETCIEVTVGMLVNFEGMIARIEAGNKGNLKFVPV